MCDFGQNEAEGTVMPGVGVVRCSSRFQAQQDGESSDSRCRDIPEQKFQRQGRSNHWESAWLHQSRLALGSLDDSVPATQLS